MKSELFSSFLYGRRTTVIRASPQHRARWNFGSINAKPEEYTDIRDSINADKIPIRDRNLITLFFMENIPQVF
tara:strand:- start:377 stop:595 length:219 start_codon:yes stop_codon:yes gene_type:complete